MARILKSLVKVWNMVLYPFLHFRICATLSHTHEGNFILDLVEYRYGRDRLGTELAWESDRARIRLIGRKSVYQAGEFELIEEHASKNGVKAGMISLDSEKKAVSVDVTIGWKPWKFNGRYIYETEEEPNQPSQRNPDESASTPGRRPPAGDSSAAESSSSLDARPDVNRSGEVWSDEQG